jgi:hypothetical protein
VITKALNDLKASRMCNDGFFVCNEKENFAKPSNLSRPQFNTISRICRLTTPREALASRCRQREVDLVIHICSGSYSSMSAIRMAESTRRYTDKKKDFMKC